MDIEDLSVNEVLNLIMETPRILKSPILVDEKRLQVGYKEDDIRAFLPRSVRNVEMQKHVCVQLYKHQGWGQLPVLFYYSSKISSNRVNIALP